MLPLAIVLIVVAGVGVYLTANEGRLIYFPTRDYDASPNAYGLNAELLEIPSAGGAVLKGWWIHNGGKEALLYFHGNGGNISHRLERGKMLTDALGLDMLLVDYRGFGRSTGSPGEAGLYADGAAIYQAARDRGFPPERIVLFGESLGSAVAIETALSHPCRAVILEAPFLSIPAMAKAIYPFLPAFLVRTRFDNGSKISRLTMPKLIAVAERDDVVPPQQGLRLYDLAAPPKKLYVIRGAAHNDTYIVGGQEYLEAWRKFLISPSPSGRGSG
ncbi:MAG TPA: alpha/beta hydrolase [Thermoanaerobaculia bacterium]|nr:alpha/beta hydrolase [Thermoanaerobaculia bacterium]